MASFVGAIEQFNPYIQQIPTEAYMKVGMFKEQQYMAGIEKVQDHIDKIAGLDIANEGGRNYLKARVDELTKTLNKYSMADFSNPNNITQLVSLAKPLYQDENIVNDVINTGIYRKWNKESSEAYKAGKMELGQYTRESSDASKWLNSQVAGSQYTGRSTPNTATKKEMIDKIVKIKKDGLEKNEYVYDINYSKDIFYYVKSTNKYYSEADFNNFVTESIMTDKDREVLMNEHWYENMGKSTLQLQQEDLQLYQSKIEANNAQIDRIINDPLLYAGDKKVESQKVIDDLKAYNKTLSEGKIKFLQELNLQDPTSRDVFHRDLSESRFVSSLAILRDEVKKEELQKNEQWFKDKELEIEVAKEAMKSRSSSSTTTGTTKKTIDQTLTDEVAVYTPVDPSAPKTELSLTTMQKGWQMKNDEINSTMNSLIGKLQENGVDMSQFIAGWDQVNVGTKGGASMSVPRFKDQAAKDKFYNMVAGLNYAYTKEAQDGHIDNKSFTQYIKANFTNYNDLDPNSKFTIADKMISDALNTLKGTSALLPKLEGLFADKGVVRSLASIDQAIKNKKDMANAYREALLKSNALSSEEISAIRSISDDDLLQQNYLLDFDRDKKEFPGKTVRYRVGTLDGKLGYGGQESDGTYAIYRDVWDNKKINKNTPDYSDPYESQKIVGGYKSYTDGLRDISKSGVIGGKKIISGDHLKKAEEFVKKTYSYVQENLNSTVVNLKQDKQAYSAIQDGLTLFLTRARLQASPEDIQVDGVDQKDLIDISGINSVEILGASVSNTEDIFNPNPMYEVTFKGTVGDGKETKERTYSGRVSLKSFLATNPNYKTSDYAKYFAPAIYAEQDAYARIKSNVNPLEGSEASYLNRDDIRPVYNYTSQTGKSGYAYDEMKDGMTGNEYQWETIPIEKDGKQTMVSYQVVSLGQNTTLGNAKTKDGQTYAPGAFYIKMKVPTSTGQPKVIFLKRPNGESYTFQNASNAHYTVRDLIFNNPDIRMEEVDSQSGEVNYFTIDPGTIRGIFNSQLSYNGFSKLETVKLKDALGKEIQKQEARELQLAK